MSNLNTSSCYYCEQWLYWPKPWGHSLPKSLIGKKIIWQMTWFVFSFHQAYASNFWRVILPSKRILTCPVRFFSNHTLLCMSTTHKYPFLECVTVTSHTYWKRKKGYLVNEPKSWIFLEQWIVKCENLYQIHILGHSLVPS